MSKRLRRFILLGAVEGSEKHVHAWKDCHLMGYYPISVSFLLSYLTCWWWLNSSWYILGWGLWRMCVILPKSNGVQWVNALLMCLAWCCTHSGVQCRIFSSWGHWGRGALLFRGGTIFPCPFHFTLSKFKLSMIFFFFFCGGGGVCTRSLWGACAPSYAPVHSQEFTLSCLVLLDAFRKSCHFGDLTV